MKKMPYLNMSLSLDERIKDLLKRMTIEEKIGILPTKQSEVKRLNIPAYGVGGEGAHGVVDRELNATTVFPQPHGLACTWNKDLLKRVGSAIGDEARAKYNLSGRNHWLSLWFPTIDMERDPRWGRNEEAYGEDPALAGKLSTELIKGAQGDDDFYVKLCTAPKHFYANNFERDRGFISSVVDKRTKHEYYLKVFEYAFKDGKALSLMTAYNEINGTPAIINKEVQTIVKDEWGCDGYIVCDGNDFEQNVTFHFYNKTHAETLAMSLRAGIDCFVDSRELVMEAARDALDKKLIEESDIDKALYNIFKVRFRLGQFDDDINNPYTNIGEEVICCDEFTALAREACTESIVLLKNDNFLPLKNDKKQKIAVIGELAKGYYPDWYAGTPKEYVDILDSLKMNYSNAEVSYHNSSDIVAFKVPTTEKYLRVNSDGKIYADGNKDTKASFREIDWGFDVRSYVEVSTNRYLTMKNDVLELSSETLEVNWFIQEQFFVKEKENLLVEFSGYGASFEPSNTRIDKNFTVVLDESHFSTLTLKREVLADGLSEATELAKNSDIVILNIGSNPLINSKECVDRYTINLDKRQIKLSESISSANDNCIMLLTSGYQYAIQKEIKNFKGVLYMAHGGQETGNSVTDVIFGKVSPSGKLPVTWYLCDEDLHDINNYDIINYNRTYQYFEGEVQYPFGYGLSYTKFEYSNLVLSKADMNDDILEISVDIKNVGDVPGAEVVQMYFSKPNSKITRAHKQLSDFDRIFLEVGETKNVTLILKRDQMEIFDVKQNRKLVESGKYNVMIGSSSENILLMQEINVLGDEISSRSVDYIIAENFDTWKGATLLENSDRDVCVGISELGELVYNECEFNNESKVHLCLGKGSKAKICVHIGEELVGNIDMTEEYEVTTYATIDIVPKNGVHTLKLIVEGNANIKDICFNS